MSNNRFIKPAALILVLLLCVPALALAQRAGDEIIVNGRGGSNAFRLNNPMPVLIYTIWDLEGGAGGADLNAGSPVRTLVIYDNGLATWTRSDIDGTGPSIDTVQISVSEVNGFVQGLRRAGAFRQNSNNAEAQGTDASLVTITLFSHVQSPVSVARTFSFYADEDGTTQQGRMRRVQNEVNNFLDDNFGG